METAISIDKRIDNGASAKYTINRFMDFLNGRSIEIPNKRTRLIYDNGDFEILKKIIDPDRQYLGLVQKIYTGYNNSGVLSVPKKITKFFDNIFISHTKRIIVPGEELIFTIYRRN